MARRIGGAGGGSDPGGGSGQTALVVGVLILALGAGGSATVAGAGSSALPAPEVSVTSRGGTKVSIKDSNAAKLRLVRQGLKVDGQFTDDAANCAEHAYGQVRTFLEERPCTALHRAQFEVRDRKGDVILVAISWVQMPDEASVMALHRLVDTHGTGNITELSRDEGRYRTVRYTGDFYASRRDGRVVVNAQAQPVARGISGLVLTSIVTHAIR